MKGIVFRAAAEVVESEHGIDAWDAILRNAGVDGAYTTVGSYEDAELYAIVDAAARLLNMDAAAVLVVLGRGAFAHLLSAIPAVAEGHDSAFTFLLDLDTVIHPEVRRHMPDVAVPSFEPVSISGNTIELRYKSQRQLCRLAEGLILGALDHFGETGAVEHVTCTLDGDNNCVMRVVIEQ